jgi:VanZ family protein
MRESQTRLIPFFCYWLPILLWAFLIFTMSSVPGDHIPAFQFWKSWMAWFTWVVNRSDKWVHALQYAMLAWLIFRALRYDARLNLPRATFYAFFISVAYGVTDEVHQFYIPNRSCDPVDLLADGVGAFSAITLSCIFYRRHP